MQKNDNSSFLPASAESTEAAEEAAKFRTSQNLPGFVVYVRDTGLTEADKAAIAANAAAIAKLPGVDATAPPRPPSPRTAPPQRFSFRW